MAVDVSTDEETKGLDVPAHYANKMFVSLSADGFRITFAEESSTKAMQPRCAVFMSRTGFAQLAELLGSMNEKLQQHDHTSNSTTIPQQVPLAAVPQTVN